MRLGVCYYPEQWPAERWPIDARQMREAGLSLIRLADFAWSVMERTEGIYTWKWLDRVIDILAGEGLQVVLCTPSAAPPPWLTHKYPDILSVDNQGRRRHHGSRRHYCPNNPTYHRYTERIVQIMAERYGNNPAVVGWQIDNEFGCHWSAHCYCDECATAFRRWLEARYHTIDTLNSAWGNVFWSQVYNDWAEVGLPYLMQAEGNPSHILDYYRFASDSYLAYERLQFDILRPLVAKDQIITTNYMSQFTDLNYYDMAEPIDRITMSAYPTGHGEQVINLYAKGEAPTTLAFDVGDPYQTGFNHALMRGFKSGRPFWVMEQQAGNVNWSTYNTLVRPGTVRLWTWHALTSGAEAVLYFRWRAGLYAQEQMHSGLLHHDGSTATGYDDVLSLESERDLMATINATPYAADVALLLDYDSMWALQMQPHHPDFSYYRELFQYYAALQRLGVPADIVSADADLDAYKLVIVPSAYLATDAQAVALAQFTATGGTVLLGVRSGFKTDSNVVTDQPLPGVFRDIVGATVTDWASLPPQVTFEVESDIAGLAGPVRTWMEALEPGSAAVRSLARYTTGPFTGHTALSEMSIEKGCVLYLAWYPSGNQVEALLSYLCARSGATPLAGLPEGLIAAQRGEYLILLNFTDRPQEAVVQGKPVRVRPRDIEIVT